jgi:hypothetical protein
MKRRLILVTCLIGIVGGSAGAAMADGSNKDHQVCIVFANNQNYHNTQDFCIDTPGG